MDSDRETLIKETVRAQQIVLALVRQEVVLSTFLDLDLSMAQLKGLIALARTPVCTVGELAERLHLSRPATSLLVDRLVTDGFVERERAEQTDDRRRTMLRLSPRGEDLLARFRQGRTEHNPLPIWLAALAEPDLLALAQGLRALAEEATRSCGASALLESFLEADEQA